jgi:hypothetical protein
MRLRPLPLVLALVSSLTLACGDDNDPTVSPESGIWNYFGEDEENNTCPAFVGILTPAPTFVLDYDGGDGFQIENGEEADVVCNLTGGQSFVCPDRLVTTVDVDEFNLELEIRIRIEGTFVSDDEAEGEQQVSVGCIGEGCGALDDIPCAYDLPFTAEKQ